MTAAECIQIWTLGITGFGVISALVGVIWQTVLTRQQIKLSFFADYTKRYQEIALNFPEEINDETFKISNFRSDQQKKYDKTMRYMRAYFDLCFEEFILSQNRYIGDVFWEIWEDGMKTAFSRPAFKEAWSKIQPTTEYKTPFEKFVKNKMASTQINS